MKAAKTIMSFRWKMVPNGSLAHCRMHRNAHVKVRCEDKNADSSTADETYALFHTTKRRTIISNYVNLMMVLEHEVVPIYLLKAKL